MSKEKFDYEEFAKSMYGQSLALIPDNIGVEDKEYLATTIKQFVQMAGEAIHNGHPEMDKNDTIICVQSVLEQTLKKGIEIITKGVPIEHRDNLLRGVAFTVFQIIQNAITNDIFNREYLEDIEFEVNKNLYKNIMKLFCEKEITEKIVRSFMQTDREFDDLKMAVEEEIRQEEFDFEYDDSKCDKSFNVRYEELTKYILENPNNPEGYFDRGYLQYCYDVENEVVLSDFDKAIELNPNYIDAIRYRMYIFEQMGEYEKIIDNCSKLVELEPVWDNYCLYIKYLVDYINDYKKAMEICNNVFELFEPDDQMFAQRGGIFYNMKEYDKAIADYKKAIELNPEEDYWQVVLKHIEQEKQDK